MTVAVAPSGRVCHASTLRQLRVWADGTHVGVVGGCGVGRAAVPAAEEMWTGHVAGCLQFPGRGDQREAIVARGYLHHR